MGKYDEMAKAIETKPMDVQNGQFNMLRCIANELAEVNRLKRLQMLLDVSGMPKEKFKQELEDKA